MKKLALALLLAAGCQSRSGGGAAADFGPTRSSSAEKDGITVAIPAGYRDSAELSNAKTRANIEARVPGAKILVSEKELGTGTMIAISTIAQILEVTPERCIGLSTSVAKSSGGTLKEGLMRKVKLGQACKVELDVNGYVTTQYYIPVDARVLVVTCISGEQVERDVVCSDIANSAGRTK
jgi:hypothetical protein